MTIIRARIIERPTRRPAASPAGREYTCSLVRRAAAEGPATAAGRGSWQRMPPSHWLLDLALDSGDIGGGWSTPVRDTPGKRRAALFFWLSLVYPSCEWVSHLETTQTFW